MADYPTCKVGYFPYLVEVSNGSNQQPSSWLSQTPAQTSSPSKVQSNNDDSDNAELSFEALVAKLHEMPEIRVEAVDKGKELLNEVNYPEDKALRTRPKFNFAADCLAS